MSEGTECHCHQQNRENGDGAAFPTFLAFPGKKREGQKHDKHDHRSDQQRWSFHGWRKQGQHRIKPQEKVIRTRRGLDNRWVRLPAWPERAEIHSASGYAKKDKTREK